MYRLFIVPTLAINFAIIFLPAMLTIPLAFMNWDGISKPTFAGLQNFQFLFEEPQFWTALRNNLVWTAIFLVVPVAMGLLAATMLLIAPRGRTFFQAVYFLPVVIASAIAARVWQGMIYSPVSGIVGLLNRFGLPLTNPLSETSSALYGVAVVDIWHWWGFLCVVFFAALRQVPAEQIEAARIDGATLWQTMIYILLPGIRTTITLMMMMTIIWSFLLFDFVYVLTQGGPAFSSEVLSTLAYRYAFFDLRVGQAAAVAIVIAAVGIVVTFFYVRIQSRDELK